jgi:hypothetical protein
MANHWAIAVGINQYQFFQPLSYAQRDAQALRNLLIEQAGFSPDRVLLLTENSPPVLGRPTYPSRENLQGWVDLLSRNFLQPGDLLWCFFSGYGVCLEGQDYLVPIEGDPTAIPSTGVPLHSLFSSLRSAPIETALVLLDMNRNEGALSNEPTGQQTIQLANDFQIATILSCQPGQFSREAPGLGHGFFTAAILESLRSQQCQTLGGLDRYLSGRLPELSEHYWRPIQQPLTIVNPPDKMQQLILPASVQGHATTSPTSTLLEYPLSNAVKPSVLVTNPVTPATQSQANQAPARVTARQEPTVEAPSTSSNAAAPSNLQKTQLPARPVNQKLPKPNPPTPIAVDQQPDDETVDPAFWQRLILGSTAVVALLVIGIFWRNRAIFVAQPTVPAIARSEQILTPSPSATLPPAPIASSPAQSPQPANTPVPVPSQVAVAEKVVTPSTAEQPKPNNNVVAASQTSTSTSNNTSEKILQEARRLIRIGQASQYNKAIAKAREIQPGQPLYQEAQQDISRWSQVILNLAKRRAEQRAFAEAIATAQLVPQDQRQPYTEAQTLIRQWQKQNATGQVLVQKAQQQIQRGQASSYWRAIDMVSKIKPEQPEHAQAQKLIARWSQTILDLANSRADQKKYTAAIQTATLVPRNTPAYPLAQKSIANWQKRATR